MELLSLFEKGGLVMYPLLVCSIIAVAILIERVRTYNKAQSNMPLLKEKVAEFVVAKKWQELRDICDKDGGAAAELVKTAALRLRAYLNYLETIVTLAPLLGLLGTVTGMIGSFSVLSVSNGEPFAITGGVGEALIATATGLCVAILALVIHAYLAQREDNLVSQMEEISAVYMTALVGDNDAA